MALDTYTLSGTVHNVLGAAVQGIRVIVTLTDTAGRPAADFFTGSAPGTQLPIKASTETAADGTWSVDIPANADGTQNTRYNVEMLDGAGENLLPSPTLIQMPAAASDLHDLVGAATVSVNGSAPVMYADSYFGLADRNTGITMEDDDNSVYVVLAGERFIQIRQAGGQFRFVSFNEYQDGGVQSLIGILTDSAGDDSNSVVISGSDRVSAGRGALLVVYGADHAVRPSDARLIAGLSGQASMETDAGEVVVATDAGELGFHGETPVAQHSTTGQTAGFTAGSGTAVNDDSTFTGGVGSTAYTVGDLVRALKQLGVLAS